MANLVELFDNIVQMQALNGVPLANGKLYVYALGRTRLMDTWSDVDGESLNTNPIILDDAGQAHVYVSDDFDYTLVVCDAYNNEVFSIDKYLYSKGEHSHADVAVAPSEHIAVSSYHVGETTVYVPYIVGELGKTYHGVEPIVVNNVENKISARNIALGVQEPLYFVEDSESACIIGVSGDLSGLATKQWVEEQDYMQKEKLEFNESGQVTGFDGSAFAGGFVDPGEFIPWSASGEFQEKGDYYSASNPSGFINSDAISSMATTGFVADVSADITAMIPTALTGEYLTKESADTLYQPIGEYATTAELAGKQDTLVFNYTDTSEISGINGSGIYGLDSITGEYELSGGNGISIENDPINEKTIISVSGDYATNSDLQTVSGEITAMIPTALTGDYLTKDSADTLYQPIGDYLTTGDSANFYTTANESGFITNDAITGKQDITGMTAYQPVGNYLTADALDAVSADWNEVSAKQAKIESNSLYNVSPELETTQSAYIVRMPWCTENGEPFDFSGDSRYWPWPLDRRGQYLKGFTSGPLQYYYGGPVDFLGATGYYRDIVLRSGDFVESGDYLVAELKLSDGILADNGVKLYPGDTGAKKVQYSKSYAYFYPSLYGTAAQGYSTGTVALSAEMIDKSGNVFSRTNQLFAESTSYNNYTGGWPTSADSTAFYDIDSDEAYDGPVSGRIIVPKQVFGEYYSYHKYDYQYNPVYHYVSSLDDIPEDIICYPNENYNAYSAGPFKCSALEFTGMLFPAPFGYSGARFLEPKNPLFLEDLGYVTSYSSNWQNTYYTVSDNSARWNQSAEAAYLNDHKDSWNSKQEQITVGENTASGLVSYNIPGVGSVIGTTAANIPVTSIVPSASSFTFTKADTATTGDIYYWGSPTTAYRVSSNNYSASANFFTGDYHDPIQSSINVKFTPYFTNNWSDETFSAYIWGEAYGRYIMSNVIVATRQGRGWNTGSNHNFDLTGTLTITGTEWLLANWSARNPVILLRSNAGSLNDGYSAEISTDFTVESSYNVSGILAYTPTETGSIVI